MSYTLATAADAFDIAQLHADSWKQHYRGICSDKYLDNEVDTERKKVWTDRFSTPNPQQIVIKAINEDETLCGFVCVYLDHHKEWGSYLDNLHVKSDYQGIGLGRALMKEAANQVYKHNSKSQMYLHVLTANTSAIGFYEKLGGKKTATYVVDLPWGDRDEVSDYLWSLDQLRS